MLRDNFLRTTTRSYIPSVPSSSMGGACPGALNEPTPMDVGAIGWDKPKCEVCGKLGHQGKDCWSRKDKGGKSKGGKGKGNKGGKGDGKKGAKGNALTCRFCGKQGHIERECWQKHGRPGKGRVQSVEQGGAEESS
eukprot:1234929-Amphidinium_carterae.1